MTTPDEMPGGLQGAVGNAVDIGRKGFGDEGDTHTAVLGGRCVEGVTWIFLTEERLPTFLSFPPCGVLAVLRPLRGARVVFACGGRVRCAGLSGAVSVL
ncbi:hypothetical protein AB0O20_34525, partial [Streptomyces kronopolitis]|uniref:hypothetical protein n=1 Tax=Streptomyces kronopolitis TaxID=1612435 RepID=UPI00342A3454